MGDFSNILQKQPLKTTSLKIVNMKFLLVILTILLQFAGWSQIGTGQWRLHVSPTQTIDVAAGNGLVFGAFPSGLVEYDIEANESTLWTDVNGLSDVGISALYFDAQIGAFWVGYSNGNIDKIQNNSVINIPALKLASVQGDKTIHQFIHHNGFVYISTSLGILKINPAKNEVSDTYYPNGSEAPILQVAFHNDSIFAMTQNRVYKGSMNNIALADPNQWSIDSRFPNTGTTAKYNSLVTYNDALFVGYSKNTYGQDSVYKVTNSGLEMVIGNQFDIELSEIKVINNRLYLVLNGAVIFYETDFNVPNVINSYQFASNFFSTSVAYFDGIHYIGDAMYGLVYFKNSLENKQVNVSGPPKNSFFSLGGNKEKITVAGGTIQQAGLTYNLSGAYVMEEENWQLFDIYNQTAWQNKQVWDVSSVTVNPKNTKEIAIGAYCGDALSISTDGKQIDQVYNGDNSILEKTSLGNNSVCITDVEYDEKGNLWMVNGYSNKPLKVKTSDGNWYAFELGTNAKSKLTGRMVIDYNGNKWFHALNAGLFAYDDNGTISNPSDDKFKQLTSGANSGALPSDNVTALAVDFDNEIWIGTDNGFAVLYNSNNVFDASPGQYNAQRIKLDFEGEVEYLLGNTAITDIEIDGGNRKWIGTANTGIFLLSADGLEILQRFTTENSPLISNTIMDMQLNHQTGEMFIITDKGMLSYRTDATYEDAEYSNVIVFPNPVKPDYFGPITIQGIRYNSDVKVTDVAGNLVYQTTSNGGTATWNGKNLNGERVQTGVYLIWTAPLDGKGRKVAKVTVIN